MMRQGFKIVLLLSALTVAACAKTFEADVARFHRLEQPAGKSITIIPIDPEKKGSLEFEQYASLVRAQLIDAGYRPTEENADIRVELDWLVSDGREKIFSRPGYYGGYPYYGGSFYHPYGFRSGFGHGFGGHGFGGYGYGGYGGYGGSQVYSVTVYSVRMTLAMLNPQDEVVFEGRADTTLNNTNLPEAMPYLVQAMFTNFPGESGRTQKVELELPKGKDAGY
ncbi:MULTISPECIES: DUF4136 domain-containing protein [unclassified Iodidimonas]|uniref:DUF4136 domain-containing protein n=1 Tax=unclassified Iodidimonas TaxID=2626145 RepID=UPI002482E960|nr:MULTISPECIES: DUF4136 domain-containing protein [unclassified Iodidimonas]